MLKLATSESYQMSAADAFGRALWTLEVLDGKAVLLNHRQQTRCETASGLRLADAGLRAFELESLPRLLLGLFPIAGANGPQEDGARDFVDSQQRRWTTRVEDGELAAWTLWRVDEPFVWWMKQPKGGILSHREGGQFRWRLVVSEPFVEDLLPLALPEGYREVPCHESDQPQLRQDQAPPPGAGSAH